MAMLEDKEKADNGEGLREREELIRLMEALLVLLKTGYKGELVDDMIDCLVNGLRGQYKERPPTGVKYSQYTAAAGPATRMYLKRAMDNLKNEQPRYCVVHTT